MGKEIDSRRMVYTATWLVIVVTALWAFLFVPRLGRHPQAIANGAANSSHTFFRLQLAAAALLASAALLLAFIVLSRYGRIIISVLLYLAAIIVFLHDFMVFDSAVFYMQTYKGFQATAILMLVCVGANLVAGVLAIIAGKRLGNKSWET